jgi:hypothetical protein
MEQRASVEYFNQILPTAILKTSLLHCPLTNNSTMRDSYKTSLTMENVMSM